MDPTTAISFPPAQPIHWRFLWAIRDPFFSVPADADDFVPPLLDIATAVHVLNTPPDTLLAQVDDESFADHVVEVAETLDLTRLPEIGKALIAAFAPVPAAQS